MIPQLAIFGPGLIGGSLALAVRDRGLCGRLTLWSGDAVERAAASRLGVADAVTDDPAKAVRGADLVLLCTPPTALPGLARLAAPHLAPGAVVSDVASVKADLGAMLTEIFEGEDGTGSRFCGSHPMAGGERSGLGAARADLFAGRTCLLTPLAGRVASGVSETVEDFWRRLGMHTLTMTPAEHDAAVAQVSHLPHLLAAALAGLPDAGARACAGPGWEDMTRLAGGSAALWTEILSLNRAAVTAALSAMTGRLRDVEKLLKRGREEELRKFLEQAKRRTRGGEMPGEGN